MTYFQIMTPIHMSGALGHCGCLILSQSIFLGCFNKCPSLSFTGARSRFRFPEKSAHCFLLWFENLFCLLKRTLFFNAFSFQISWANFLQELVGTFMNLQNLACFFWSHENWKQSDSIMNPASWIQWREVKMIFFKKKGICLGSTFANIWLGFNPRLDPRAGKIQIKWKLQTNLG